MSRALFDRGSFGARAFDDAFAGIFGVRPRTIAETEGADSDEDASDIVPLPVSQADAE